MMNSYDQEMIERLHHGRTRSLSQDSPVRWQEFVDQESASASSSQFLHDYQQRQATSLAPELNEEGYYTPTQAQIDFISSFPIQCFCNKPAQRKYTLEYGPILECASFDYTDNNDNDFRSHYICGFHIHERYWTSLVDNVKKDHNVNLQCILLRSCPCFNFTVCTIFKAMNTYNMSPPLLLPVCFCNRPVSWHVTDQGSVVFECKNRNVEGVGRCSWSLTSIDVAFPKPRFRLHSLINFDEYYTEQEKRREQIEFTKLRNNV